MPHLFNPISAGSKIETLFRALLPVQLEKHAAICWIDRDDHLVSNHSGNRPPIIAQSDGDGVGLAPQRKARVGRGPGQANACRRVATLSVRRRFAAAAGSDFASFRPLFLDLSPINAN